MAVADSYRLPHATSQGAPLGTITTLSAVGTRPHLVLGCTTHGSFALWDTWRRQLLLAVAQVPGLGSLVALRPVELLLQLKAQQARGAAAAAAAATSAGAGAGAARGGVVPAAGGVAPGVRDSGASVPAMTVSEGHGQHGLAPSEAGTAAHTAAHAAQRPAAAAQAAAAAQGHTPVVPSSRRGCWPAHMGPHGGAAATPMPHTHAPQNMTQGTLYTGGWSTGGWPTGATHVTGASTGPYQGPAVWEPELLSSSNPLVMLALVRQQPEPNTTPGVLPPSNEHGRKSHSNGMKPGAGCLRPVLALSGAAYALPPLGVPGDLLCCDARGSCVVMVSGAGDVVMWECVHGKPLWALQSVQAHGLHGHVGRVQWPAACAVFCTDSMACVGSGQSLLLCSFM